MEVVQAEPTSLSPLPLPHVGALIHSCCDWPKLKQPRHAQSGTVGRLVPPRPPEEEVRTRCQEGMMSWCGDAGHTVPRCAFVEFWARDSGATAERSAGKEKDNRRYGSVCRPWTQDNLFISWV